MTDTHTHLYFAEQYPDGGVGAVERAIAAGVTRLVMPNVNLDSVKPLLNLHFLYPDNTYIAPGLHPQDVDKDWRALTDEIFARFAEAPGNAKTVAVGEVGVDLYFDSTYRTEQMDAFGYQLDKAHALGLPVIIHSRAALDETLDVIKIMGDDCPRLLFHSFTSTPDDASRIVDAVPDAIFGINGVVTFKNAPDVREAVSLVGIDRVVLETDSPYLAPVPLRGRTNESGYLGHILDKVAEVTATPRDEAERVTDATASRFFNI